jgi:hypothetical protein
MFRTLIGSQTGIMSDTRRQEVMDKIAEHEAKRNEASAAKE